MREVVLQRLTTDKEETLGALLIDGYPEMLTLELPYKDNEQNISCIPYGEYVCKKTHNRTTLGGLSLPETFEVTEVENRGGILFHMGNTTKDTSGCILVGSEYGNIGASRAILQSRKAFTKFLALLVNDNEFKLYIVD